MADPTVEYKTIIINGRTYIISPLQGFALPGFLSQEQEWVDRYGNPKWEILPDGTIAPSNLTPTPEQIEERETLDRMEKAQAVLIRIIVKAIKTTSTPLQSWQAIDAALRSLLP